jgi:hypothetical protein
MAPGRNVAATQRKGVCDEGVDTVCAFVGDAVTVDAPRHQQGAVTKEQRSRYEVPTEGPAEERSRPWRR